jgi:formate dehydrogenase iron-sulfur subunit
MTASRRDFLKLLGAGSGLAVLSGALRSGIASAAAMTQSAGKAMLYDASKCVGCRACQNACKDWNVLPPESDGYGLIYDNPSNLSARTWTLIKAREYTFNGKPSVMLCRYQCMHCTEASCEKVCPTGAISHQGAAVEIDQKWCIGCGYCVQACPYGVPHKPEGFSAGPARKCTFCIDRQAEGLEPACVAACPADALRFGERAELLDYAKTRTSTLKQEGYRNANVYGENEFGGLHALYILTEGPSVFGLPATPVLATSKTPFQWLSGVIAAAVIAVLPAAFLFRRKKNEKPVSVTDDSGEEK